ncbi:hypothetical protein FQV27_11715 [Paracoccus aurantiacus]|uniref:Integral membrane protein n=1 Tax=Paracoccus aurantiacus TaxID=2599412 RepID=A0A5C6S2G0_9RHOB|nr:hypothetical protein [Paracoccus aurantiacus]TXB68645.1 hypothetical protein FQV27_11715 [Paracoccus aurantiacus]
MKLPFTLRQLIWLDAATCLGFGTLIATLPSFIAGLTRIPSGLLFWAGLFLILVSGIFALLASRPRIPAAGTLAVVAVNIIWVLASLMLLAMLGLNAIGVAFILAQAAVVGVIACAELVALRSATDRPAVAS